MGPEPVNPYQCDPAVNGLEQKQLRGESRRRCKSGPDGGSAADSASSDPFLDGSGS